MKFKLSTLFLLLISLSVFGEEHKLYGTVKERDTGLPLPSASVSCDKTTKGVFTNEKGYYELMLQDGSYLVMVEFVGFKTISKKLTINGKDKRMDFVLDTDYEDLEEVMVSKHRPDVTWLCRPWEYSASMVLR